MSKKIVIDKEQIDFVTLKKLRRYFGDNDKTLFEQRMYSFIGKLIETFDSATEIDTDQSIEERAKKYAENKSSSDVFKESHINDYIKGATEQDLISKAREKESVYFFIDEEGNEILSNECKPKEKCGDSDWWFDEVSKTFRRYYTYYDELEGTQIVHEEHLAKLKN